MNWKYSQSSSNVASAHSFTKYITYTSSWHAHKPLAQNTSPQKEMGVLTGLGAAFEQGSHGLVVTAIYPGGPIFLRNEQQASTKVQPQVCMLSFWIAEYKQKKSRPSRNEAHVVVCYVGTASPFPITFLPNLGGQTLVFGAITSL